MLGILAALLSLHPLEKPRAAQRRGGWALGRPAPVLAPSLTRSATLGTDFLIAAVTIQKQQRKVYGEMYSQTSRDIDWLFGTRNKQTPSISFAFKGTSSSQALWVDVHAAVPGAVPAQGRAERVPLDTSCGVGDQHGRQAGSAGEQPAGARGAHPASETPSRGHR